MYVNRPWEGQITLKPQLPPNSTFMFAELKMACLLYGSMEKNFCCYCYFKSERDRLCVRNSRFGFSSGRLFFQILVFCSKVKNIELQKKGGKKCQDPNMFKDRRSENVFYWCCFVIWNLYFKIELKELFLLRNVACRHITLTFGYFQTFIDLTIFKTIWCLAWVHTRLCLALYKDKIRP